MTRADARPNVVAAALALAMAAGAALALTVADAIWVGTPTADGPGLTLIYVVGWMLLAWAAVIWLAAAVHLVRSAAAGRRLAPIEIVLVAATAAVLAGVLLIHPLLGSGQGLGTALG